jgi:hypothetical protein
MNIEDREWREEYIEFRNNQLSPNKIRILATGPRSPSTSWILDAMYQDWKNLKSQNYYESGSTAGDVED